MVILNKSSHLSNASDRENYLFEAKKPDVRSLGRSQGKIGPDTIKYDQWSLTGKIRIQKK